MAKIKIDYQSIDDSISVYTSSLEKMKTNLTTLENNMLKLNDGWEGEAKVKFMNNIYKASLKKSMNNDIKHIEFLLNQLKNVKKEFKNLESRHKNLKL